MFSRTTYQTRRRELAGQLSGGIAFFPGNREVGINYKANAYRFRQDSFFLYYFGIDRAGVDATIDLDTGEATLYGEDATLGDLVWTGPQESLRELADRSGIEHVESPDQLPDYLDDGERLVHYLPPYHGNTRLRISNLLNLPDEALDDGVSEALTRAVVAQRNIKTAEEIAEMERALLTTKAMHETVMRHARPGMREAALAGMVRGIAMAGGGDTAYGIILTKNGQTLHNHHHDNIIHEGDLILGDFGAETAMGYAADITRTFPVSPTFDSRQRAVYQAVLEAELNAIEACRPGVAYRDVHRQAAQNMAERLRDLGLMRGNIEDAVAQGAHALFFPHGLGHMIGLDVHDMEGVGEDYVGYTKQIQRSEQFGTAFLRLGRKLEAGNVITVEPGLYFIPELIDQWQGENKFSEYINYDALEQYRDFGGIRIEDNVLITKDGHRVLGEPIARSVEEVEALRVG